MTDWPARPVCRSMAAMRIEQFTLGVDAIITF